MASFTDSIPQFNPYIQQLPVEEMVKVGMEKQRRYDEGVQKIQTQINNVAGLDILRDVDKNYLQSKLNSLGNNLKMVAAGDFSNYQLVNSVSGMTSQIIKDKNIEIAVNSTAWYRKQAAQMEDAVQKGKSSQSNIYDFNDKVNTYVSSTDLGRSFNDRYTQYTDVKKKALESIKMLHPQLQKYDIPFEVVNGKINTQKIADAMKRYKIEGIDEGQIKAAISATLTPDDINQLSIDAKYQFRGVSPDALEERAKLNYKANKESAIATIKLLNDKKGIVTDPVQLDVINKNLEYYNSLIGSSTKPGELQVELDENLKNIRENPNAVKDAIYKDGFVKELSNAFSWKNEDMEYVTNPIREQMNWVADMKLKQQVENRQRYEFGVTTALRQQEINLKAEENALKKAELYGVDSPWTTLGNPTDNVLQAKQMFTEHIESVSNNINAGMQTLKNAGYNDDQINMMLNKKIDIPAKAMGTVQEILRQQNYLKSLQDKDKQLKDQANTEVANDPIYKQKLADANNFANSINGGNAITLTGTWDPRTKSSPTKRVTPKEMIDNLTSGKAKIYMDAGQIVYNDGDIHVNIPAQSGFFGSDAVGGAEMRPVFTKILEYSRKGYFDIKKDATKKADEVYREKLAPLVSDFVPQIKALGSEKNGSPTAITLGKVSALITATIARGTYADKDFSPSTSSDMLSEKKSKDTRIFIQQAGDSYQVILKSESDPTKLQRIQVSKEDLIANFGPQYINTNVQESTRLKMGRGNTNITGDPNQGIMQKSFGDFPKIRKMNITADFDQDLSNPNLYVPSISIKKKDGEFATFILSGVDKLSRVGFDQGKANLNALTDDVLLKYLKTEYPSYDYSQLDIK